MPRDLGHTIACIDEQLAAAQSPCMTSSFQAGGVVLLHLLRAFNRDVPILFLDTVHHFAETYAYRDELARRWRLNVITIRAAEPQPGLWRTNTQACCARHKVAPLFAALEPHDVWFTGLRRDQSPSRTNIPEVDSFVLPSGTVLRKVNPLVSWTTSEIFDYAVNHGIPLLPLYDAGYTSVGCEPCTSLPIDPDRPRSGRWGGDKLECGIHLQLNRTGGHS